MDKLITEITTAAVQVSIKAVMDATFIIFNELLFSWLAVLGSLFFCPVFTLLLVDAVSATSLYTGHSVIFYLDLYISKLQPNKKKRKKKLK